MSKKSVTSMMEEDAAPDAKAVMAKVSEMVGVRNAAALKLEQAEQAAKEAKKALFKIECEDIPELLRSAGLKEVTTEDGTKVTIKDEITCGVSEARKREAYGWLREHGFGGVIKMEVTVAFNKDEVAQADDYYLQCFSKYGERAQQQEAVHAGTLKALLKEQLALGAQAAAKPPFDLFGILPYTIAVVKTKKASAL